MRVTLVLVTLGCLADTAAADEDLAAIARDAEIARIADRAEVNVCGRHLVSADIDRVRVIEEAHGELRGLHCDRDACVVVTVDAGSVRKVLREPLAIEIGDSTGLWFATGATVSSWDSTYYDSPSLRIRMELVGANVGTSYADDGATGFEVRADVTLPGGTALRDDDGDLIAYVNTAMPARLIEQTDDGSLVEVTDGSARVVGFANLPADPADAAPAKKRRKRTAYSTRLLAGTVLYREPGGDAAGVVLSPASVRRVDEEGWSDWTAWRIDVGGVTSMVWTRGEPLVKKPATKKPAKKKRRKRRPATSRT